MKQAVFIAGTDTDAGKTLVSTGLLAAAAAAGITAAAIKPVAAGCEQTPQGLRNADALQLQALSNPALPYEMVNPVALAQPIAPHLAAAQEGRRLRAEQIAGYCRGVLMQGAQLTVVEGAGGWRVPLNERQTMADLVRELNLPVLLVVAVRLGCINHALLTAEAILRDGLALVGWVANQVDPVMACYRENLQTLAAMLPAPCLGELPFLASPSAEQAASFLQLDQLRARLSAVKNK